METSVKVEQLPNCDFCGETAEYDIKTTFGPWANACHKDFLVYGMGIGLGRGQKLEKMETK
jgi:hypothetical protein